jgi:Thioredoxin like C-terminal domain
VVHHGWSLRHSEGRILYRFHARDLHLVMAPTTPGGPIRFRVRLDAEPPGAAHGTDTDDQGNGTLTQPRLYQLVRQPGPNEPTASRLGLSVPGPVGDHEHGHATRTVETTMTTVAGTDASFGALKQVDAGLLRVGYVDAGPPEAPAVILLHEWPYDIHSYAAVTRCWQRPATGWSSPTCAGTGPPGSGPRRPSATASKPRSRWTWSPSSANQLVRCRHPELELTQGGPR